MKVKMLVSITGTCDGAEWPARGGVVDLPAQEAADMIAGGLCAAVEVVEIAHADQAPAAPVASVVEDDGDAKKRGLGRPRKADAGA